MQKPGWRLFAALLTILSGLPSTAQSGELRVEVVARGLEHPWALAFIGEGKILVSERPGRLRVIAADGKVGAPVDGLPAIEVTGQGGLLDVVAAFPTTPDGWRRSRRSSGKRRKSAAACISAAASSRPTMAGFS